ncbi:MAG: prepilin-type N-terminal cleavage/methylation domain-containing protein [Candidatus Omnitrophica bacterium]|nr:prepilin-type N-terminal cleavage/methylation domain-containing protein [Candidatus Omnitrophota bacterium]
MKNARGFTLLELLTVVVIVAILASVAMPQFIKTGERARASEAISLLGALRSSEIRYKAQTGSYTNSLGDLDVTLPQTISWDTAPIFDGPPVTSGKYKRTGAGAVAPFLDTFLGINFDTGVICGNFPGYTGTPACP